MKDSDLRAIVLQSFYEERRHTAKIWGRKDIPSGIEPVDFFDICGQLAQQNYIDWKPIKDIHTITGGRGKITASGVDVVEGNTRPLIAITFAQSRNVNVSNSHNVQIGDRNSLSNIINVEELNAAIARSDFSESDKAEAKSRLGKLLEHPLINSIVGGVVSGLASRS